MRVGGYVWHIFRNYALSWTVLIIFVVSVTLSQLDFESGFKFVVLGGVIWFVVAFFIMVLGLFFKQSDVVERGSPDG